MRQKTLLVVAAICISQLFPASKSLSQSFEWAKKEGGDESRDFARKIIFDDHGNMYVIGTFGTINGGTTIIGDISLTSKGGVDVFVAKYDVAKNLVWIRQGGSILNDYIYGLEMDEAGNVYVCGIFSSSIGGFSSPMIWGSATLTSFGRTDIFVVALNNEGDLVWGKSFGSQLDDQCNAMTKNGPSHFLITGGFKAGLSFGNIHLDHPGTALFQAYVASFNSEGTFVWAKGTTGQNTCIAVDLATDTDGNILITGFFSGTVLLDNVSIQSHGEYDVLLSKYKSNGAIVWAESFGGIFFDYGLRIETHNNDIFLTGSFDTAIDFGNNVVLNSFGAVDTYVCKFGPDGVAQWAKGCGGPTENGFTSDEVPADITTDVQGNCYLTGGFAGRMIFDGDTIATGGGSSDVYLVKYDRDGNVDYIKQIRSLTAATFIFSYSLGKDVSQNIIICGAFTGSAQFDNISLSNSGTKEDLYIARVSHTTGITGEELHSREFTLQQNYPNPFNPGTTIRFSVPALQSGGKSGVVSLIVYDVLGREVATLVNEEKPPGIYEVTLDGSNLGSGVYFYRITTGGFTEAKAMLLTK